MARPWGTNNSGTVWEMEAGTNTVTTLATFSGSNGGDPESPVFRDANGNLYGTTYNGGPRNLGTVWELKAGSNTITTLGTFDGTNGANPLGSVVMDAHGNLFGAANLGGSKGEGTVWEIAAGTTNLTALVTFNTSNGADPYGGVTIDSHGNLYGTTNAGGAKGSGTVWQIAAGTSNITTLSSSPTVVPAIRIRA